MTTTIVDLLDEIRAHLATFELPDLYAVTVATSSLTPHINAQLADDDPPLLAAALLSWADTLTEPAVEVWRVPDGDSVHLTVTGRLPRGANIRVFGGMAIPGCNLGADLAPGARSPLLLGALRAVAELGEVQS